MVKLNFDHSYKIDGGARVEATSQRIAAHHPSRGASGPTSINPPENPGGTNGHSVAQTCECIPARQHNTHINHVTAARLKKMCAQVQYTCAERSPPLISLRAGVRAQLFEPSPVVCTHRSRVQCLVMTAPEDSCLLPDWQHSNTPRVRKKIIITPTNLPPKKSEFNHKRA